MKFGVPPRNEIATGVPKFWKYGIQRKMKIKITSER